MASIEVSGPVSDPPSGPPKKQSAKPPGGFKRKRTGCMTCRRRKIKCCERKPICLNCEKARRECTWVGGGDIFKHDQNPSVAEKRETKFYRGSASSWTVEDQQRLMTPSTTTREFQFVSMNNDARHQPSPQQTPQAQVHAPPNLAALQTTPYQHMDLQALASAATYMPLPPTTYGESANQGSDAMIDPNLDAGTRDGVGQSTIQGTTEQASGESRDDDDIEKRVARALTSVSENETAQTVETAHAAANEIEKE